MVTTGNPMLDMQNKEMAGRTYTVLLKVKNGHCTAQAIANKELTQWELLILDRLRQRNMIKE